MRIAVVEPMGRGGLIHYALQMSRGLVAAGADVSLVTDRRNEAGPPPRPFHLVPLLDLWDPKPEAPEAAADSGLVLRARRARRGVRYVREWRRLVAWLRAERFDVVQLGDVRFVIELPFLARLRRSEALLADVCHNVTPFALTRGSFRPRPLTRLLYRRIYRLFDLVFVHFEANRERFLATWDVPADRVRAIPMGNGSLFRERQDPSRGPADLRRELGLPVGAPIVLLFGTLSPYKGVDLLLKAFTRVRDRIPEARLLIVGHPLPGFDLPGERRRAACLGLAEVVRFVPRYVPTGEVGAWMELADLCVFPYRELSQSGAVQVPLAFGVPVVATDVGAMREALADGEAGRLVPAGDPEALGDAVARLLATPGEARALGRNGAELAHGRDSWERIGERVLHHYRERLAARGTRSAGAST